MRMKLSVLVCLAGIGVTAAMGAAAAGTAKTKPKAMAPHASAQLVAQGKDVFAENCIACHQEGAVGLPGTAPSLVNKDLLSIAFSPRAPLCHSSTAVPMTSGVMTRNDTWE